MNRQTSRQIGKCILDAADQLKSQGIHIEFSLEEPMADEVHSFLTIEITSRSHDPDNIEDAFQVIFDHLEKHPALAGIAANEIEDPAAGINSQNGKMVNFQARAFEIGHEDAMGEAEEDGESHPIH